MDFWKDSLIGKETAARVIPTNMVNNNFIAVQPLSFIFPVQTYPQFGLFFKPTFIYALTKPPF